MASRSPAGVPGVTPDPATTSSTGKPLPRLKTKRYWPSYTPDEQHVIGEFLAAWRVKAERGLRRAEDIYALDQTDHYAQSMVLRWRYTLQAIDWLSHNVPLRQEHLALKAYFAQHGALPPCPSSPEQSPTPKA